MDEERTYRASGKKEQEVIDDSGDEEENEEEDLVFYENFKTQATQAVEDNKTTREQRVPLNHSKLTEQIVKLLRKGVYKTQLETKC